MRKNPPDLHENRLEISCVVRHAKDAVMTPSSRCQGTRDATKAYAGRRKGANETVRARRFPGAREAT